MTIMHYAVFPKYALSFQKINSPALCVFRMGMLMGGEQFTNDFKRIAVRYHTTGP